MAKIETTATIEALALEALRVQDACNLSGVAQAFARVMSALCDRVPNTDPRNRHPIAVLWADKIAHLTGTQTIGTDAVMRAYDDVRAMTEGKGCRQCGKQDLPDGYTVTCGASLCQEREAHRTGGDES